MKNLMMVVTTWCTDQIHTGQAYYQTMLFVQVMMKAVKCMGGLTLGRGMTANVRLVYMGSFDA
jgi:hypothetical protein